MRYTVSHTTAYAYSEPASLSQNELFLVPRRCLSQRLIEHSFDIRPTPQYRHRRRDYFGNTVDVFMVQHPHDELAVTSLSSVETLPRSQPPAGSTLAWEAAVARLGQKNEPGDFAARPYLFPSPLVALPAAVADYARVSFGPGTPLLAGTLDLMGRIHADFAYDKSASTVDTGIEELLADRRGVCQDFAHLAIACLRALGLAARYVSGYLETVPPPGKPRMLGADASHAWVAVYLPGHGWIDFDPTNNLLVDERHITLAWGRDYADVAPVRGVVMGGGRHRLSVKVSVVPAEG